MVSWLRIARCVPDLPVHGHVGTNPTSLSRTGSVPNATANDADPRRLPGESDAESWRCQVEGKWSTVAESGGKAVQSWSDGVVRRVTVFLGTHTPKLDEKGRLILPAKFRDELADGLVITRFQERCLAIWPMERVRRA